MLSPSPRILRALFLVISSLLGIATLSQLPTPATPPLRDSRTQIDWSRFAYTQYATDRSYLCNSLMIFEALHRLQSKADRVLMYPSSFMKSEDDRSPEARLLRFARDEYAVKLTPVQAILKGGGGAPWSQSYTKLLAFNQTEYDRVLNLDSDATLLQPMDELFLLPPTPVAMPQAYWLDPTDRIFTSGLMLIQPSTSEFLRLMDEVWDETTSPAIYDMEIMNKLYGDSAAAIPHRPYLLLTGEFRSQNHEAYLGNAQEEWDAQRALGQAKYLHFSDWPVPKPWVPATHFIIEQSQPPCEIDPVTGERDDCRVRELWLGIYSDFTARRQEICGAALQDEDDEVNGEEESS
ncbi:nucleotide-diphospho-sugar transferase [Aspergillus heteromorphus CBS 117.55]|uniref:Nucleotide-diphospho-sugar transferase n=1 Tax=Aspergillus heteromorphus CBS 117.55 TaxID=1448321 RepID=A0A317VQ97_9EURO|nr:nucleotide-diphospho-sugar transferase [Aspergillus heteromorphus CBS 117.55]PWY75052.1 nucleotide-diphospho-sugar transferase [Aspergillus heteromorphus CBS 117.55]